MCACFIALFESWSLSGADNQARAALGLAMRILRCLVPVVTSTLSLLSQNVLAHSYARNNLDYISLVENPVIHTPGRRIHAHSSFDLSFELHQKNERVKLSLEPNNDVVGYDTEVDYLGDDGKVQQTVTMNRHLHRVFKGYSWVESEYGGWTHSGSARIVVQEDGDHPLFEGTFTIDHIVHQVMLRSSYMQTRQEHDPHLEETTKEYMVLYRNSDIAGSPNSKRSLPDGPSCGSDDLDFNNDPDHPLFRPIHRRDQSTWASMPLNYIFGLNKRQDETETVDLKSTIGSTKGCPRKRKVALVGVAADCTYSKLFNSTQAAQQNIVKVVNSASEIFEKTFNISLGLKKVTVLPSDCGSSQKSSSVRWNQACGKLDIGERLNLFSAWRGQQKDKNAFWTLLTNCGGSADQVGLAWLGKLCVTSLAGSKDVDLEKMNGTTQSVAGASVVKRTDQEWQVFAHEAGHIFGAVHDCDEKACESSKSVENARCCPLSSGTCDANAKYLMNPRSSSDLTKFSPCTTGQVCTAMGRNAVNTECLTDNRDVDTYSGSICGNGIVEDGEDCDCGGEDSCKDNKCCDPKKCKFINDAVCDDSNEECCNDCKFSSSDTVCRKSNGECDPEEKCPGDSGACPTDKHKENGESCGKGLKCASGQCTSRDLQCQTHMGKSLGTNDTYACDKDSCTLLCGSKALPKNTCSEMLTNFLDGTACGAGGTCKNGVCDGQSAGKEVSSWIDSHKPLVIGLAAGIGGLLLLSILSCLFRRSKRPRHRNMAPINVGPAPTWAGRPLQNPRAQGWQRAQSSPAFPQPPPAVHNMNIPPRYG